MLNICVIKLLRIHPLSSPLYTTLDNAAAISLYKKDKLIFRTKKMRLWLNIEVSTSRMMSKLAILQENRCIKA
ncbi:MAG: hypothetical protein AAF900_01110 [Bacteroidota bacterium]